MEIRQATAADIPAVVEMARAFYPTTHYADWCDMDDEAVARFAQTLIDDHILLVAVAGGIVGMVALVVAPFVFNPAQLGGYEVVWWVNESARGSTVAVRLLKAMEAACKARGVSRIQMVHMPNSPPQAEGLYRRAGYAHSETSYTKAI